MNSDKYLENTLDSFPSKGGFYTLFGNLYEKHNRVDCFR